MPFTKGTFDNETFDVACASVTVCLSGLVVLTAILFPTMLRRSHFMRLIVTISACDFLSTIFLTAGFPANGSYCAWQGFAWYFFSRGSWFFTSALACQLYFLLAYGKLLVSEKWMHVVCWVSNVILGFVVFGGATYGVDVSRVGSYWCKIKASNLKVQIDYNTGLFVAPLIITTFLLIIINVAALVQYYIVGSIQRSEASIIDSDNAIVSLMHGGGLAAQYYFIFCWFIPRR